MHVTFGPLLRFGYMPGRHPALLSPLHNITHSGNHPKVQYIRMTDVNTRRHPLRLSAHALLSWRVLCARVRGIALTACGEVKTPAPSFPQQLPLAEGVPAALQRDAHRHSAPAAGLLPGESLLEQQVGLCACVALCAAGL